MMRQKEYIYLIDDLETTPRKQPDLESGGKVDMEGKRGGGGGWGKWQSQAGCGASTGAKIAACK
jgi:hypothetical protein